MRECENKFLIFVVFDKRWIVQWVSVVFWRQVILCEFRLSFFKFVLCVGYLNVEKSFVSGIFIFQDCCENWMRQQRSFIQLVGSCRSGRVLGRQQESSRGYLSVQCQVRVLGIRMGSVLEWFFFVWGLSFIFQVWVVQMWIF